MTLTIREQWRRAALANQGQIIFRPDGPVEYRGDPATMYHCAISLIKDERSVFRTIVRIEPQPCPVESCDYSTAYACGLAVHLNNVHRWDWLTLACKFPLILPEDQAMSGEEN